MFFLHISGFLRFREQIGVPAKQVGGIDPEVMRNAIVEILVEILEFRFSLKSKKRKYKKLLNTTGSIIAVLLFQRNKLVGSTLK